MPILIAGGGIGGLACALALSRQGFQVKVLEQASQVGEIGAGIQLGPNAFAAFDALGVGDRARSRAVYTERMVMMDAIDASVVADVPLGEAFRRRFGNPYAVIHRADVHQVLLEGVQETELIEFKTSARVVRLEQDEAGVPVFDAGGSAYRGCALIGCDGVKSAVRQQIVGDDVRVTGHVVYRAVVEADDFPQELRWNYPTIWVGPDCHLVHYPLRGGDQFNLVVTFHSARQEVWGVSDGDQQEVLTHFQGIHPLPHRLLDLPKSWRRWATADREPIARWSFGLATLLGDAAHPMMQYLAQGACMALEDAVTLGAAIEAQDGDLAAAFARYEHLRVTRTARMVLSTREMGRIYHAKGVERLVRNSLWTGRTPERYYDALEWIYGWTG
ncbi:MAG: 3-hydroxybenzoate 6-monooxygenase [Lautropia sp.]|nr:3-hydroxybenzoate 6-monooxygenase [Lautropia sp.]